MIVKLIMFSIAMTIFILLVKKVLIPAFAPEEPVKSDGKNADHIQKFDNAFDNLKGSITQMEEVVDEIGTAEEEALKFAENAADTIKQGKKIIKQVSKIKGEE